MIFFKDFEEYFMKEHLEYELDKYTKERLKLEY